MEVVTENVTIKLTGVEAILLEAALRIMIGDGITGSIEARLRIFNEHTIKEQATKVAKDLATLLAK